MSTSAGTAKHIDIRPTEWAGDPAYYAYGHHDLNEFLRMANQHDEQLSGVPGELARCEHKWVKEIFPDHPEWKPGYEEICLVSCDRKDSGAKAITLARP